MPKLHRTALLIACATALAGGLAARRLTRFAIAEDSMAPALRDGDWVVAVRMQRSPRRGDVVIFDHPARPGFAMVKRVVALPGETHASDDAVLHAGAGEVVVLGDNRAASADDSRALGPVAVAALQWRVVGRYWPWRR